MSTGKIRKPKLFKANKNKIDLEIFKVIGSVNIVNRLNILDLFSHNGVVPSTVLRDNASAILNLSDELINNKVFKGVKLHDSRVPEFIFI